MGGGLAWFASLLGGKARPPTSLKLSLLRYLGAVRKWHFTQFSSTSSAFLASVFYCFASEAAAGKTIFQITRPSSCSFPKRFWKVQPGGACSASFQSGVFSLDLIWSCATCVFGQGNSTIPGFFASVFWRLLENGSARADVGGHPDRWSGVYAVLRQEGSQHGEVHVVSYL